MQRCQDLSPCLVTANNGGSKETEDKAVERRSTQHDVPLHGICVILHQNVG